MEKQLTITMLLEPVDSIDEFIQQDILAIVQNTGILPAVQFWGHEKLNIEKADEHFLKKIVLVVTALSKANAHRRNHKLVQDNLLTEIAKYKELAGTNVDLLFNKIDSTVAIEGFFSQIKTSLDLLAQSLKYVYGFKCTTWKRKLINDTGIKLSGMKIVSLIDNLPTSIKAHAIPISDLITNNAEQITKIVRIRDSGVHYGKLHNVQGFRYSVEHKKVVPPIIALSDTEAQYAQEYMEETLFYISHFVQNFVITLLSNLLSDMVVRKAPDGTWSYYSGVKK
jgi:hypothetical protein